MTAVFNSFVYFYLVVVFFLLQGDDCRKILKNFNGSYESTSEIESECFKWKGRCILQPFFEIQCIDEVLSMNPPSLPTNVLCVTMGY